MSSKTTKTQIINRINIIVKEYVGADGMHGIKSHSVDRLQARLEAYERMISLERASRSALASLSARQECAYALMGDEAPAFYKEASAQRREAMRIWTQQF